MELWRPKVTAPCPRWRFIHDPSDLGKVGSSSAMPDGERMTIPTSCRHCIEAVVVEEHTGVWGISVSLNWVDIASAEDYKE